MVRSAFPALLLGLVGIEMVSAETPALANSGQILVLNDTDSSTASISDSIGCLDASGAVTASDCATFAFLGSYPYTLSSNAGNCSFTDSTQPANTDSVYGADSYA